MNLYVITVIQRDYIVVQTAYVDIDKAVQSMIYEMHRIVEKTDISYKHVKELEQEMWQSSRDFEPNYKYTFGYYDIYMKTITVKQSIKMYAIGGTISKERFTKIMKGE